MEKQLIRKRVTMNQLQVAVFEVEQFHDQLSHLDKAEKKFISAYSNWLPCRKECITRLEELAVKLDEVHFKSNQVSLTATFASAVGGVGFITGLVLSPFTGGLSSVLATAGALVSGVGSATSIISSLGEFGVTRNACEQVQNVIDRDKLYTEQLIQRLAEFDQQKENINSFIEETPFTDEQLCNIAKRTTILCKKTELGRTVLQTIATLIATVTQPRVVDAFGTLCSYLDLVGLQIPQLSNLRVGQSLMTNNINPPKMLNIARKGFATPARLSKTIRLGMTLTAGASVALDIWSMASIADDMDKGSKSETAEKFREISNSLHQGHIVIRNAVDEWTDTYTNSPYTSRIVTGRNRMYWQ